MHWAYLMLAIGFEVVGTTMTKLSDGFSKLVPTVLLFVFYGACLFFLSLAFKRLPVSVAYTMWGSVGTVLVVVVGRVVFDERLNALQIASIALVVVGVAGLNLTRSHDEETAPRTVPVAADSLPAVAD